MVNDCLLDFFFFSCCSLVAKYVFLFFFFLLQHLHGKFALHPFCNRKLPVVCDDIVDPEFGTGMEQVTN